MKSPPDADEPVSRRRITTADRVAHHEAAAERVTSRSRSTAKSRGLRFSADRARARSRRRGSELRARYGGHWVVDPQQLSRAALTLGDCGASSGKQARRWCFQEGIGDTSCAPGQHVAGEVENAIVAHREGGRYTCGHRYRAQGIQEARRSGAAAAGAVDRRSPRTGRERAQSSKREKGGGQRTGLLNRTSSNVHPYDERVHSSRSDSYGKSTGARP